MSLILEILIDHEKSNNNIYDRGGNSYFYEHLSSYGWKNTNRIDLFNFEHNTILIKSK